MTIDTKALRELAQKATPGPWYERDQSVWYDIGDRRYLIADLSDGFTDDGNDEYIAAANPAVVLSLLNEIDRLREIKSAAENPVRVKGRYHTEQAMNQLMEVLK